MAEAREQDTGMDMIPGYERPTRSAVVDTAEQNVTESPCMRMGMALIPMGINSHRRIA